MIRVPKLITPAKRTPEKTAPEAGATPEERREISECLPSRRFAGFERFCERHVWVEDKESNLGECRLILWPGQRYVAECLVTGQWLILVKARQLGITWLLAAFVVWRFMYAMRFRVMVILQERLYAYAFVERVKFIHDRLPEYFQMEVPEDNKGNLTLTKGRRECKISALVGSDNAGRSFTGDLAIFDEAPRIPEFAETLGAIQPTMTRTLTSSTKGQLVVGGSSKGPTGRFKELWDHTYGENGELLDPHGIGPTHFKPLFLSVMDRPGRDETWYAERCAELDPLSPVLVKQEHPRTIDEAWEYAEGRVYALFTRARNVGEIEIPPYAQRFRAIDWGESKSAYVVLWIAYIEGPPGFLIHPDCVNTIREFLSYRLDPDTGWPAKKDDHTCDAVRYGVVTHKLHGLVYVYREIYRLDSVAKGWNPMDEIVEVHQLSGWRRARPAPKGPKWVRGVKGEYYALPAVADPSLGKIINQFTEFDIECLPSSRIKGPADIEGLERMDSPRHEVIEGIRQVAALIAGSEDMDDYYAITRRQRLRDELRRFERVRIPASQTLEQTRIATLARELLADLGEDTP
jgi:hypothetical protein